MKEKKYLDAVAVKNFLPHRYPFLLIDRVLEYSSEHVKAIKNVTFNEPFFTGHFPEEPVMPGVLQIETIAQAAAFLSYDEVITSGKKADVLFMTIDSAKFRKIVIPGDQLVIDVTLDKKKRDFWFTSGTITVDGAVVCEAKVSAVLRVSERSL